MRMIDTLTSAEIADMYSGNAVGIFPYVIDDTDIYVQIRAELSTGYYLYRSGLKTLSPMYSKLIELYDDGNSDKTPAEVIGKYIRSKYSDKWKRIYDALVVEQYDVLADDEYTMNRDATNKDTTTYDTETENNGTVSSKETTTTVSNDEENRFGFNSVNAVGDTTAETNETETTVGLADDNATHNVQTKSGTDMVDYIVDEETTKTGRKTSGAKLVEEELNLRDKQNFYDIIYRDIDSIATIQIYI